ncbi:spore coat protein [Clostridium sp. MT-14]|uniref:Spore coat protein n=1 Tax=Clostridium aromativorans TaxID=2836848 RepID=A0ABS8N1X8_9CLOT|nr:MULTISPECIES: spore coat protein [Clostridium]KAA8675911.1 spore coat protein [Clostridium sp. HV4-5-A1G]MCC9293701.1 spore coat protein [Clostridium aromativorans]CAB1254135.1 Spore coat protein [Clostridiaceae bacterium BL-3]
MYCDNIESYFIKYLESKKIFVVKEFKNKIKYEDLTLDKIKSQICTMGEFHEKTLGYTGVMNRRLDNNIGKVVEQYKIYTRRFKKDIVEIEKLKDKTDFQKKINEIGEKYLTRAEKCLDNIYQSHYMDLIIRSMNRVEMCLRNTYFDNLRKNENKNIEIIDIKGCCYNMVEMDAIYFLSKLKRKNKDIDFNRITSKFCKYETLNDNSVQFILSMVSYPREFMRCYSRYKYHTKDWGEEEYLMKLNKSIDEDGDSLI